MKVCMVTDFYGGVGGIHLLSQTLQQEFERQGHLFFAIHVGGFESEVSTRYFNLDLAKSTWQIKHKLESIRPDFIFIMGEMNLSSSAVMYCRLKRIPFLTFYQSKLPEFLALHLKLKPFTTFKYLEWYHSGSTCVLSVSQSMTNQLIQNTNIRNIQLWFGGIDPERFHPKHRDSIHSFNPKFKSWPKPILLCVSRASKEKNLEAFMELNYPGTLVFVGEGTILEELRSKYPNVQFLGAKFGQELSAYYAAADVFIFPSKADAFGMVNLEALASGVPIVAFDVPGVQDIVEIGINGYLATDGNLPSKVDMALNLDRTKVHRSSTKWTIEQSVLRILKLGKPIEPHTWKSIVEPNPNTLIKDLSMGIYLLVGNLYCCTILLLFGMFNEKGLNEGLITILYSWAQDLKFILRLKTKVK